MSRFRWYRRWRGGVWARVDAPESLWGYRWVRLAGCVCGRALPYGVPPPYRDMPREVWE